MPQMYYSHAIREALREEMQRDPQVFLMGEDIAVYGGAFRVTKGLLEEFGPERVRNTPISEGSFVGIGVGAALLGSRPVVEMMFMDFLTLALDQLLNHAAKFRFMYGEQARVPLVIRCPAGGRRCYGPTHSQCLESLVMSMPGVKIAAPSSPADAKGLLKAAVRDDNPVLFVESKILYGRQGEVPEGDHVVPLGQARVARIGEDVTIVTYSQMVEEALKAAELLAEEDIDAEVIDLRTLNPLDLETISASVEKTGKVIVAEEGHRTGGVGAEIGCRIMEELYYYLDGPIRRVAARDVPVPCSAPLEQYVLPDYRSIVAEARAAIEQD